MQRILKVVFLAIILSIFNPLYTPVSAQSTVITADNVAKLEPVAWLSSQGNLVDVAWAGTATGTGESVAFSTSRGIWLYNANDFAQPPRRFANLPIPTMRKTIFSPDGKLLYALNSDGKLNIWDVQTSKLLGNVKANLVDIQNFALTSDGSLLAVAGRGPDNIALIDTQSHETLARFSEDFPSDYRSDITFTPDNKYLIVIPQYRPIRLWSVANGKLDQLRELSPKHQIQHSAVTHDGKLLLLGGQSAIEVWDIEHQKLIGQLPTKIVPDSPPFEFSPDGRTLAVASGGERLIQFWDTSSSFPTWNVRSTVRIAEEGTPFRDSIQTSLAFSPDSKQLMVGKGNTATLWDVEKGSLIGTIGSFVEIQRVFDAQFTSDGSQIWLHVQATDNNDAVVGWDAHTLQPLKQLLLRRSVTSNFRIQPHGTKFVIQDFDGAQLIDREIAQRIRPYAPIRMLIGADFSPDGQTLYLTGFSSPVIYRYDMVNGTVSTQTIVLDSIAAKLHVSRTALSSSGKLLLIQVATPNLDLNRIQIWDMETAKLLPFTLEREGNTITQPFAFSPNDSLVAVVDPPYNVAIYDVKTGKRLMQTDEMKQSVRQLTFSADQSILAVATEQFVQLWDVKAGRKIRQMDDVSVVAFNPDNTRFLIASSDGGVTLWGVR